MKPLDPRREKHDGTVRSAGAGGRRVPGRRHRQQRDGDGRLKDHRRSLPRKNSSRCCSSSAPAFCASSLLRETTRRKCQAALRPSASASPLSSPPSRTIRRSRSRYDRLPAAAKPGPESLPDALCFLRSARSAACIWIMSRNADTCANDPGTAMVPGFFHARIFLC